MLAALACLAAACAPRMAPATLVITLPPRPSPTATPSDSVCRTTPGSVSSQALTSPALGGQSLPFQVYLPGCYAVQTGRRFPVLYLLHGLHMDEKGWSDLGAPAAADALIQQGTAPFMMVMPLTVDDDRMEPALAGDVTSYIDSHYRTRADRADRALGGMSRGAGWAVRIGFKHPDEFGALGLHSPAILLADDSKVYGWIQNLPAGEIPRIYIDIGDSDDYSTSATWLAGTLTQRAIPHDWHVFAGGHASDYWRQHLPDYLRWYAAGWPATGD